MGAMVMDNAHIGSNSIIAAGAVVPETIRAEPGSIYAERSGALREVKTSSQGTDQRGDRPDIGNHLGCTVAGSEMR